MEKSCRVCKRRKNTIEFRKRKSSPDGYDTICKECHREASRRYYQNGGNESHRIYYAQNREERRKYNAEYYQRSKPARTYDPIKSPARVAVAKAIQKGVLVRPHHCADCNKECKPDAHHHKGYSKSHRLDVVWLCRGCHALRHNPEFAKVIERMN